MTRCNLSAALTPVVTTLPKSRTLLARRCAMLMQATVTCLLLFACHPELGDSTGGVAAQAQPLSQAAGYDLLNVPTEVAPGTMASVDFVAPPDHSVDDWIGLYSVGAANSAWDNWLRVPAGSSGSMSMAVRVWRNGPHEFRYFLGKTYNLAATSPTFSVTGAVGPYALSGVPATVSPGVDLSATFSAPAAHSSQDWVGLYAVGASATQYKSWAPVAAGASGTLALTVPRAATGAHQLRYFAAASYDEVATSSTFQVTGSPGIYSLSGVPASAGPGSGVSVTFNVPTNHSVQDWIGLYAVGAAAAAFESWLRVPVGATGTLQLSVPLNASGSHEVRYFVGDSYDLAATSAALSVSGSAGSYALSSPVQQATPGTDVEVNFNVPASHGTLDWVGLYAVGAANDNVADHIRVPTGAIGTVNLLVRIHASGPHEFRYFVGDTYDLASTSDPFEVAGSPGSYAISSVPANARNGQVLTVVFASPVNHSSRDWIGLYPIGAGASNYVALSSVPNGATGSVSLNVPSAMLGAHELRYFVGYVTDVVATSLPVQLATAATSVAQQSYLSQEPVTVSWIGAMNATDRIAVVLADSTDGTAVASASTGGQWSGNVTFTALPPATYQARLYDALNQVLAVSQSFAVWPPTTIATNRTSYFSGQNISVQWTGVPSPGDWIAIAPAGSLTSVVWASTSTEGAATGEYNFGSFGPGIFVARFFDDTARLIATSSNFTVYAAPALLTDHSNYLIGDSVVASWSGAVALEGQIVVALSGSSADSISASTGVSGVTTASHAFANLPLGDYELRFFDTESNWLSTSAGFRVAPGVVSNDKTGYGIGDPIVVTWRTTLAPVGQLVVAPAGSDPTTIVASTSINAASGSYTFTGLPIGDYEVRVLDDSSQVVATTGGFSVYVRFSAAKTSYTPNNFIVASWRDCPNNPQDRIVIAPEKSADTTTVAQIYPSGVDGAHAFGPLLPGSYRARYFSSNGAKLFESDVLTITAETAGAFVQVDLGDAHSCGVTADHRVRCWGYNGNGQLGDGTTTDRNAAVPVIGITTAVSVDAGGYHSCAVLSDGTVRCWGYNGNGQLGDGTFGDNSVPVEVLGISNAVEVSAGIEHSCARLSGGTIRCWGYNGYGQLGNGSWDSAPTPITVTGIEDAVAVTAGAYHSCAMLNGGAAYCWGANWSGQLGNGTLYHAPSPAEVSGLSGTAALSAGYSHSCAVLSSGAVHCWGYNGNGQLGDATTADHSVALEVTGIDSAVGISLGSNHSCVRLSDGAIRCWGYNAYGQLGNETTEDPGSLVPVQVTTTSWANGLAAGGNHTCTNLADGTIKCWGYNSNGQLGDGTSTNTAELDGFASTRSLSTGANHACASSLDGQVRCWGGNWSGQLGDGTTITRITPTTVMGISSAVEVVAGESHSCSTLSDGHVRCWGSNWGNQLGNGSNNDSAAPVEVAGISTATATSAGHYHNCALLNTGSVTCWGYNEYGQLGAELDTALGDVTAVTVGAYHSCALIRGGHVKCWGVNWWGQLGDRFNIDSATPVEVVGIVDAVTVSAGGGHSCAVLNGGAVWCWGANWSGQLGDGTTSDRSTAVEVRGITNALGLSLGDSHSCALLSDGRVMCWGYNGNAQLGDGTTIDRRLPIELGGVVNAQAVAAGYYDTCVLHSGSKLRCWGYSSDGELGDGRHPYSLVPQTVMQQ